MQRTIWFLSFLCLTLLAPPTLHAGSPQRSRAVTDMANVLIRYFARDAKKLDKTLGRTAILVSLSDEFDPDLERYIHNRFEEILKKNDKIEIVQCFQCETPRAMSDGNRIVVEKGLTNNETANEIARELSLETFLRISFLRSGNRIYLQVKALDTAKQDIVFEKTYRAFSRFFTDRNFMITADVGPAYSFRTANRTKSVNAAVAVFMGERFHGFGVLGAGVSSVFSIANFTLNVASGPYIGVNLNEAFGFHWPWGYITVFANPAYSLNNKGIGLLLRGGTRLSLGSFSNITAEYQRPVYTENKTKEYATSAVLMYGIDFY